MNPRSLANLQRGYVPASRIARMARASKAGYARAAKFRTETERAILQAYGPMGLELYRRGRRAGYNAAYQRARRTA